MEVPLRPLDTILERFARRHEMSLGRNGHDWPERSLRWGGTPGRLIQIYLENEEALTWNVWLCAFEDRPSGRFWKSEFLRRAVPIGEIRDDFMGLLEEALRIVEGWSPRNLEPVGSRRDG